MAIAAPIVAQTARMSDAELTAYIDAMTGGDADPFMIVVHALGCALSRLSDIYGSAGQRRPDKIRCAWCAVASGNSDESWSSTPQRTPDDARKHVLSCENNPLVVASARLVIALDKDAACDGAGAEVRNAFVALRRMIAT
jgi:hypothetical protein